MAYWLLQYSPRVFNLEEALQHSPIESWTVVRYLDEPRAGDEFVLWRAGSRSQRGVVALGRITSRAVEGEPRPGPQPHWIDQEKAARHRHWLPIQLTRVLQQPVLAVDLAADPRFANATILREFRSGNPFRLTDDQWAAITDQIPTQVVGRNPPWARDEIILALDLYLRRRPSIPGADDPEVIELSTALRDQVAVRNLDIVDAARLFAAVDMSVADALISVWHAKYVYGFWRPITAITLAGTDGNPATTADPTWVPLLMTPPYPDYPSGYNVVNSTVTHGLQNLFDTRHLQLTLISTAVPGVERHYDSGRVLRRDVVDARVWLGIHFRFADTASRDMGGRLAAWTLDHYFQPIDEHKEQ